MKRLATDKETGLESTLKEQGLLDPSCYFKSYMHRETVNYVLFPGANGFLVSTSLDGHLKLWKRSASSSELKNAKNSGASGASGPAAQSGSESSSSLLGLLFIKHFKAHSGPIASISCTPDGSLLASSSSIDRTIKIFDVANFDMITMIRLDASKRKGNEQNVANDIEPNVLCWVKMEGKNYLLSSEIASGKVHLFDPDDGSSPVKSIKVHSHPITCMSYVEKYDLVISCDTRGIVEMWSVADEESFGKMPKGNGSASKSSLSFNMKSETDLFEFAKKKTRPTSISVTPDNEHFVCLSLDRIVRIFQVRTGKIVKTFDESLEHQNDVYRQKSAHIRAERKKTKLDNEPQANNENENNTGGDEDAENEGEDDLDIDPAFINMVPRMDDVEFGRRMALEKELEKSGHLAYEKAIFDSEGTFLLYPTVFGIKIVDWKTGNIHGLIGRGENGQRYLGISMFQGTFLDRARTLEEIASQNPLFRQQGMGSLCLLAATAFKKARLYLFSNLHESNDTIFFEDRDILNEKPEDTAHDPSGTGSAASRQGRSDELANLPSMVNIHTTMGDIKIKLYPSYCPNTCLNFLTLAREGYYNNVIFHRVIPGFMVQTGDPTGTGTGGESMWGREFEDEFHSALKHDSPYVVSMANAGPNTNASQFFITVVNCPWLDNVHTIFGKVVKGFETVHAIEKVKTLPDINMPVDPPSIINIDILSEEQHQQA